MRKLTLILLILLFLGCFAPLSSFGQATTNITVNASVSDCVDFTWNMHRLLGEEDPWGGDPDQTVMDFKKLLELDPVTYPGRMFTDIWFCVFLWITADEPYHIKQTTTLPNLYNRTTNNPNHNLDNSFIVVPDYNANDKWDGQYPQGLIGNDALGSASLVKNAGILYYGNDGISHILRLYYSIPAQPKVQVTGWQPIPTTQATGTYQGTVTITITPQSP